MITLKIRRSFLIVFLLGIFSQLNAASAADSIPAFLSEDESHGMVLMYVPCFYMRAGPIVMPTAGMPPLTVRMFKKHVDEPLAEIFSRFKEVLRTHFFSAGKLIISELEFIVPSGAVLDSNSQSFIDSVTSYQVALNGAALDDPHSDNNRVTMRIKETFKKGDLIVMVNVILSPVFPA